MNHAKAVMYAEGRRQALALQAQAPYLTGTELIGQEGNIPAWNPGRDYSGWEPGSPVCDGGQVWTLLIPHNAASYDGRPAALRTLWGLAHTTDPAKAKPWTAPYGTSGLYRAGECCTYNQRVWRNLFDGNAYPPAAPGAEARWEDLGEAVQ